MAWYINEEGDVYCYDGDQKADFPNDFHRPYATQDEAELAAAHLDEAASGEPEPEMLSYHEALNCAIFAINTLMHPEASDPKDVDDLERMSESVVMTLCDIRETVVGVNVA